MRVLASSLLFALVVGCNLHAEEPKQRSDMVDPPAQYGDTHFSGMEIQKRGPGADAGAN